MIAERIVKLTVTEALEETDDQCERLQENLLEEGWSQEELNSPNAPEPLKIMRLFMVLIQGMFSHLHEVRTRRHNAVESPFIAEAEEKLRRAPDSPEKTEAEALLRRLQALIRSMEDQLELLMEINTTAFRNVEGLVGIRATGVE